MYLVVLQKYFLSPPKVLFKVWFVLQKYLVVLQKYFFKV